MAVDWGNILKVAGGVAGSAIGGPLGGAVGSTVGGMVGNKIGGEGGGESGQNVNIGATAMGLAQSMQGRKNKKQAEAAMPAMSDPNQLAFLAELQQKKNALNTGAQYSSAIDAINDKMAQTQGVIARNTGGDAAGTISGLLKSQQVANQGYGQVMAEGQRERGMYTGLYGDVLNKIAQRKLELGLLGREQALTEWAQNTQQGAANALAGMNSASQPGFGTTVKNIMGLSSRDNAGGFQGRSGVEGFTIGEGATSGPNFTGTNPMGTAVANQAKSQGIDLSSLTNNFSLGK